MEAKAGLNQLQIEILGRIVANDVPVTSRESWLSLTVYALRRRGLVETVGPAGSWVAMPTAAGRECAERGVYPKQPAVAGRARAQPHPAKGKIRTSRKQLTAAEIAAKVEAAGGRLTIPDPSPGARALWRRSIQAAIRDGLQIHHTGRNRGDLIIVMGKPAQGEPRSSSAVVQSNHGNMLDTERRHPLKIHHPEVAGQRAGMAWFVGARAGGGRLSVVSIV